MERDSCLDCALDACDLCADGYGDNQGCCCGRIPATRYNDDEDDDE